MALPTSTIVLGLLTAVPFGLAIKDTISGTGTRGSASSDDDELVENDPDAEHDYERYQREREEAEAKARAALDGAIDRLIPSGTAGRLGLAGYEIGAAAPPSETPDRDVLERVTRMRLASGRSATGALDKLTLTFPAYVDEQSVCLTLSKRLANAWGDGEHTHAMGEARTHFVSETAPHTRVTFVEPDEGERCQLVAEPAIAPAAFLTKAETSTVPLWAVGKPAKLLVDKLGDTAFSDATQIRWTTAGVGAGLGGTELYARIVKGKIVTLAVKFQASASTIRAVAEQLVADLGEPLDGDPVVWPKAKVTLTTVDDTMGEYDLLVGAPLPEE